MNEHKQRPKRGMGVLLMAFIIFAAVLGALMLQKYEERKQQPSVQQSPSAAVLQVTLFFGAADGSGLVREWREIEACGAELSDCVLAVLEELLNGPLGDLEATLPANTSIQSVRVEKEEAIIDLGGEIAEGLPSGSQAEIMAVYAIVNTVVVNFPQIKTVRLLIGGKLADTLKGHIDLREPLPPDFTMEKQQSETDMRKK